MHVAYTSSCFSALSISSNPSSSSTLALSSCFDLIDALIALAAAFFALRFWLTEVEGAGSVASAIGAGSVASSTGSSSLTVTTELSGSRAGRLSEGVKGPFLFFFPFDFFYRMKKRHTSKYISTADR
jgi:hypothetical protein